MAYKQPCIHYKLRNFIDSEILPIEGSEIRCSDLKDKLHVVMRISKERFGMNLLYAHNTQQIYQDDDLIQKYTMVLVQRVPLQTRLPKTTHSEFENKSLKKPELSAYEPPSNWASMSEGERLSWLQKVETEKWSKRSKNVPRREPNGPPPVTYLCRKCNSPGHWIQDCPLKNFKKATGLMASELMPASREDPLVMITADGRFVKRICDVEVAKKEEERRARKRAAAAVCDRDIYHKIMKPL
ncbi:hypothetical protein L596_009193 [Steinernema carpocapsae]|uniref:CCHC-type domain-containing protein n=1 Tax=Steinernema carpocapsae TaxID=34508 RepID=A0A4U5PEU3_STECR|nr:hypothetical protein L596_009193 [Steinernema carpocapsae]